MCTNGKSTVKNTHLKNQIKYSNKVILLCYFPHLPVTKWRLATSDTETDAERKKTQNSPLNGGEVKQTRSNLIISERLRGVYILIKSTVSFNVLPKAEFGFYTWPEEKHLWPDSWGSEGKKKRKKKENLKINLFLNSVSDTGRQVQRLTASILSGSERSAAPMPPYKRSDILVIFSRHTWFLITSQIDVRGFSQTFAMLRGAWARDQKEIQSESERHRKSPVSLGCVTDGLRRLTLVEYSLGHPMLTSMAATSFSLDEQQHTVFFPQKKDNKRLNTNHSYEHTHTELWTHTSWATVSALSGSAVPWTKKKQEQQKNSQPSSSLCDWPPEVQQVSSVSPSGRQLCPSPAHRSWTWRDHRERQNPPCPTHLTQMQDNTVWVKRWRESASHSGSPAGEGHPPFTTRRHWAILMSISSWKRRTNQHLETELRL